METFKICLEPRVKDYVGRYFEYNGDIYYLWKQTPDRILYAWCSLSTDEDSVSPSNSGIENSVFRGALISKTYKLLDESKLIGSKHERKYLAFKKHKWESLISN